MCFFPTGIWVKSFMRTSLPMQSSGVPVSETSTLYCQALMTAGGTANSGAKPLATAGSQQHLHADPTSHLVTNRAYTASKVASGYVSELSVKRPSEEHIGTIPRAKSESVSHMRHTTGHTLQRNDITDIYNNKFEYVCFIPPDDDSSSHSANTLGMEETEELFRFSGNETSSRIVTSAKDNDHLYCEIKDSNDDEHYSDTVLPASGYAAAAVEGVVVERDKLLQRVSRLTTEKQQVVYKLRDFVATNAQLYAELERSRAAVAELQNKLHEVESLLEREQHDKALINSRLMELSSLWTSNSNEHHEQSPDNIWQRTLEGPIIKTGEVDSLSSSSSSGVQAELRQAVQLAMDQQRQLESLRGVVEQQNGYISRLCRRDVTLGLELRQTIASNKDAVNDASRLTSAQLAATAMMTPSAGAATAAVGAAAAAIEPVKPEAEIVVSRRDDKVVTSTAAAVTTAVHTHCSPTTSPRRAVVDTVFSTHLPPPPPPCGRRRGSPPTPTRVKIPASRPTSHTAPARPLARREPELVGATQSDLESLPVGFEMTTACPICQTPIPFDAASSDAFSRHVDECISRETREGPAVSSRQVVSTDRTCPVCYVAYPTDKFSQTDFERHVNDHFADDDPASHFQPLL